MVENLYEIDKIIQRFLSNIKKDKQIYKVYIYGSYAKGIAGKWSDIDLAIVSPDFSEDLFEERLRLMKLALEVDDRIEPNPCRIRLGRKISILIIH